MGEVWKSVRGESGGFGTVGKSVWEIVGEPTHSFKPLPTLIQHLSTHPPHVLDTSFHTFPHSPHTFLHLPPHPFSTLTSPEIFSSPPPTLPLTSSQPPRLLQHFPVLPILHHLPHTKISHFSRLLPNLV